MGLKKTATAVLDRLSGDVYCRCVVSCAGNNFGYSPGDLCCFPRSYFHELGPAFVEVFEPELSHVKHVIAERLRVEREAEERDAIRAANQRALQVAAEEARAAAREAELDRQAAPLVSRVLKALGMAGAESTVAATAAVKAQGVRKGRIVTE